jgi:hypothetical protein
MLNEVKHLAEVLVMLNEVKHLAEVLVMLNEVKHLPVVITARRGQLPRIAPYAAMASMPSLRWLPSQ